MAEVVDAIVAQLEVRLGNYVTNFATAEKAARSHAAALADVAEAEKASASATGRASSARRAASNGEVSASKAATDAAKVAAREKAAAEKAAAKAATDAVKAATRDRVAAEKAAAREVANAAKAAERERQAALKATQREQDKAAAAAARAAEREQRAADKAVAAINRETEAAARLAAVREANSAARVYIAGTGQNADHGPHTGTGPVVLPNERSALAPSLPRATAPAVAAPEVEINHLLADRIDLQQRLRYATRDEKVEIQDQLAYLQRIAGYRSAGLSEVEAINRAEAVGADLERSRAVATAERQAVLERQMRAKSSDIGSGIVGAGSLLLGGIGLAEVSHLNDEYIKLQNTLRVAGVATGELDQVQSHLLTTANRSGTDIGALADVYRGAALASKDLGASQADLLKITDAAANALRIQGRSSGEARGALLQLSHAFESGRVTSREFNSLSLNLYPILQAVAKGSDQFGGSVAKLRQALLDGDISSKVFFQDLLRGSDDLAARAGRATLTTAQGFNALKNSLVVYFGEADKAQGVSASLGGALQFLAAHLDELIPALAAVGTALGVGYVTRLAAAASATEGLGKAVLGAFGGPVGLAITAATLAVGAFVVGSNDAAAAVAKGNEAYSELQDRLKATSTNAVSAAGGVAGVGQDALGAIPKVNAFAGAVGNLAQQLYNQARAARAARVESLSKQIADGQANERRLAEQTPAGRTGVAAANAAAVRRGDLLAVDPSPAIYRVRSFLSRGRTDREAQAAYEGQVAADRDLQRQLADARDLSKNPITARDVPGGGAGGSGLNAKSQARLDKLEGEIRDLRKIEGGTDGKRRASIERQISRREQQVAALQSGASVGAASAGAYVPGGSGRRGPSADTLERRAEAARVRGVHDEESYTTALKVARDQQLKAQAELSNDAEKRADLERDRLVDDALANAKNIIAKGPKDPRLNGGVAGTGERSAPEVTSLLGLNVATLDLQLRGVDQAERRRTAEEAASLDRAELDIRRDQVQAQQDLAKTTAARKRLADQLLDIDYQQKANDLHLTLSPDSGASPNDRTIAQKRLDALPGQKATDQRRVDQQYQGVGAAYRDSLKVDRTEFLQSEEVKALQGFNAELDNSVAKALHLHGIFGQIIGDLIDMAIKQAIIKPLAGKLFGGGGDDDDTSAGIGGIAKTVIGLVGSFFGGRATGGSVVPGASYLVGERGPEVVRFGGVGHVYPNGALPTLAAPSAAGGGQINLHVEANDYFDARVARISGPIAQNTSVRVVRAAAPGIAQAGAAGGPGIIARKQTLGN